MEGIMRKRESIMIGQRLASTGQNLTSTIEIKAPTVMATNAMLATAVDALQGLSPHLRIRDARKNHDSRKNKNKPRRDEVIINRPLQAVTGLGKLNGAPVEGKAITDPKWKSGSTINATMQTNTPLGGISDIQMTQESMIKTLEFVEQGQNLDVMA